MCACCCGCVCVSSFSQPELNSRYVNGIPLGPGMCVVDEGGSIVPVSKCTVKELRAEAEARSIMGAQDMKKPELAAAIKVGGKIFRGLSWGGGRGMMG